MNSITRFLRSFKLSYIIANLFQAKKLRHNKILYKKYGLTKSIYGSISSKDFEGKSGEIPWLDRSSNGVQLEGNPIFKSFAPEMKDQVRQWSKNGYVIYKHFIDQDRVTRINEEIERLARERILPFEYDGNRMMFALNHSKLIHDIVYDPRLMTVMNFLIGKEMHAFQTINFKYGSNQLAHSDAIHMTTFPLGFLTAAWWALEPTNEQNGPLHYYPGSHKLPYLMNGDFDNNGTAFRLGNKGYHSYERKVQELIHENGLEKKIFYADPGDLFIWHANILHGGEPVLDKTLTRKSMVAHYFSKDVICYHEITQRPAYLTSS